MQSKAGNCISRELGAFFTSERHGGPGVQGELGGFAVQVMKITCEGHHGGVVDEVKHAGKIERDAVVSATSLYACDTSQAAEILSSDSVFRASQ